MATDEITIEPYKCDWASEVRGEPAYTVNGVQLLQSVADLMTDDDLAARAISYGRHPSVSNFPEKNIYAILLADRMFKELV